MHKIRQSLTQSFAYEMIIYFSTESVKGEIACTGLTGCQKREILIKPLAPFPCIVYNDTRDKNRPTGAI